jgi:fructokinase
MLPGGKVAGGAPMNVAFHLRNFELDSALVSRVGQDPLGEELLAFLTDKGIPSQLVQQDAQQPTSTVQVQLDEAGHASYEIVAPVAWDFIEATPESIAMVQQSKALVFGSLAARNPASRSALLSLLEVASLTVFDVNLRPPHYSQALLETLLAQADLVKMNEEELAIISGWYAEPRKEEEAMQLLIDRFHLEGILLTKGGAGAAFLGTQTDYTTQSAYPITVKDTVGSGDSFLAAFLSKFLAGKPVGEALPFAAATGALVATQHGGTPAITAADVQQFMTP